MTKEKIEKISNIALIAGIFTLVFVLSLRRLADYDLWGHLKAGEYLFKTGSILTTHYFNFSWPEFPYLNHEWLFQAIIYGFYNSGGEAMLVVLQILLVLASFLLLYMTVRLYSTNIPLIVFVLAVGALASSHRFALRPQHFSYVFLLINLYCLHQYSRGNTRYLYLLPPVMLFWVNIHAESLWGLAVPAVFIAVEAIRIFYWKKTISKELISEAPSHLRGDNALPKAFGTPPSYLKRGKGELISPPLRGGDAGEGDACDFTSQSDKTGNHDYELLSNFKKLISVYALVIAASLINPFTYKTVIWPFLVMSEQFAGVEELLPSTTIKYLPFWIYFCIFIISAPFSFKRIPPHFLVISLFFSAAAWIANRGIPHFIFASAPVVVAGLTQIMTALKNIACTPTYPSPLEGEGKGGGDAKGKGTCNDSLSAVLKIFWKSVVFILILSLIISVVTNPRYLKKFDNVPYPERAVEFIKNKNIKGNMFNLHGWGGYIIWELYPSIRPYIDNRFFHRKFFMEYEGILSGGMDWKDLLDKYRINIVFLDYSLSDEVNLRDYLFKSSDWGLVYWDDFSLLYLRNDAGFEGLNKKYLMRIVNPDTDRFKPQELSREILMSGSEEVTGNIGNAQNSWKARFILGNIRYYLSDHEGAISNFEEAARLSFEPVPAIYFNLGQAYMAAGRLQDAERSFKEAAGLTGDKQAYQSLWRIYILQGRQKEADEIFRKHLSRS